MFLLGWILSCSLLIQLSQVHHTKRGLCVVGQADNAGLKVFEHGGLVPWE